MFFPSFSFAIFKKKDLSRSKSKNDYFKKFSFETLSQVEERFLGFAIRVT